VLVEASFTRTFVITSDCKNGPEEIIKKNNAGFVYHMNDEDDFIEKYKKFKNSTESNLISLKKRALIKSKEFSIFNHSVKLISIVKNITTDI
jgi:glycosyltransferase involved in cell wall biosynthesis